MLTCRRPPSRAHPNRFFILLLLLAPFLSLTDGREHSSRGGVKKKNSSSSSRDGALVFLHVGKAGGGTIRDVMGQLAVPPGLFSICHTSLCPDRVSSSAAILINVRDPIDRFVSFFEWRNLILCRAAGDRRRRDFNGQTRKNPATSCRATNPSERRMIDSYGGNKTRLAEALLADDPAIASKARKDLASLGHHTGLAGFLGSHRTHEAVLSPPSRVFAAVLEPPFPFTALVADAMVAAICHAAMRTKANPHPRVDMSVCHRAMSRRNATKTPSALVFHSSKPRSGTGAPTSPAAEPLSELGQRAIAQVYAEDYQLIARLAKVGCAAAVESSGSRGSDRSKANQVARTTSTECSAALNSIIDRRRRLLPPPL